MASKKIHILSTRPVGALARERALHHGILIDEKSFIETQKTIDISKEKRIKQLLHQNVSVVFTSMNAVEAVGNMITEGNHRRIFCIGNTTRK